MSLTAFTGVVDIAVLRSNFDDATAQLTTNSTLGAKDQTRVLFVPTLAPTSQLLAP